MSNFLFLLPGVTMAKTMHPGGKLKYALEIHVKKKEVPRFNLRL